MEQTTKDRTELIMAEKLAAEGIISITDTDQSSMITHRSPYESCTRPANPVGSSHEYRNSDNTIRANSPFRLNNGIELVGWGYLHIA